MRSVILPIILGFFVCFGAFAQTVGAQAQPDSVGVVNGIEGTATIKRGMEVLTAEIDGAVFNKDVVETPGNSKISIVFKDDTEIVIGENSRLEIDEYVFSGGEPDKGEYSILRGAFLYISGLMTKKNKDSVSIRTPHGSIGVRGTKVWGGEIDDEYGIYVLEGKAVVENQFGRQEIDAGTGITFEGRNKPSGDAFKWPETRIARATQAVTIDPSRSAPQRQQRQIRNPFGDSPGSSPDTNEPQGDIDRQSRSGSGSMTASNDSRSVASSNGGSDSVSSGSTAQGAPPTDIQKQFMKKLESRAKKSGNLGDWIIIYLIFYCAVWGGRLSQDIRVSQDVAKILSEFVLGLTIIGFTLAHLYDEVMETLYPVAMPLLLFSLCLGLFSAVKDIKGFSKGGFVSILVAILFIAINIPGYYLGVSLLFE